MQPSPQPTCRQKKLDSRLEYQIGWRPESVRDPGRAEFLKLLWSHARTHEIVTDFLLCFCAIFLTLAKLSRRSSSADCRCRIRELLQKTCLQPFKVSRGHEPWYPQLEPSKRLPEALAPPCLCPTSLISQGFGMLRVSKSYAPKKKFSETLLRKTTVP